MRKILIKNATAPINGKLEEGISVRIGDGKILETDFKDTTPDDTETVNAEGRYLLPSFIELHAHGGGGFDVADSTKEAFQGVMDTHLAHGVTLLCPTLVASEWSKTIEFLTFCDEFGKSHPMFGGAHLEGPFLSPVMCGAQNLSRIITPTAEMTAELAELASVISCITAAPENEGCEHLARVMKAKGVSMSVGHSNADSPTMEKAAEWGFDRVTHLFSSTSRRAKQGSYVIGGIEESALIDKRFTVELIGDGHHVSRESFLLTEKCKGKDGVVLVSDAMRAAGCDGLSESYLGEMLPENRFIIEEGVAKLPDRSSFAGSVAVGDTIVAALCGRYGLPIETVSHMMSAVPARLMGLNSRGKIEKGFDAELVLLDKSFKTVKVFSEVLK
ncbi:MAG: amidohydrolase family protein [Clostridia bacterium]|nr:amidohydrolase family protein [Clostridia bacterium]